LQLVTLNMDERKVELNEEALGHLNKRLNALGSNYPVAVVSVMGAFRTGKSFILDLFLRFLKWEMEYPEEAERARNVEQPPRKNEDEAFPLPAWMSRAGTELEGNSDESEGFRFKGGMDHCTEGIWIWSEPFIRSIEGKEVAVLLMDTQGAWDGKMTKEQSATIFGLTTVMSSKQIYNISKQIQEDKVDNLTFFIRFAQQAIGQAARQMGDSPLKKEYVDSPFQSLDFLVRDFAHFKEDASVPECMEAMEKHLQRHVNQESTLENSTAKDLHTMFRRLRCFCLPNPGKKIEKESWTGKLPDLEPDFIRFVDLYVREVFTSDLHPKNILGLELSTITFQHVLRNYVGAFSKAAPDVMLFNEAQKVASVLMAKERALKTYTKAMDEEAKRHNGGIEPDKFKALSEKFVNDIKDDYSTVTIFGNEDTRNDTWREITENLKSVYDRYSKENDLKLEKVLVSFANVTLLGFTLFVLDRMSDWTCDWWSQTCTDVSKLLLLAYLAIFAYVGVNAYMNLNSRGWLAASLAGSELWKEMVRLMGEYGELAQQLKFNEIVTAIKKACGMESESNESNGKDSKKDK